MNKNNTKEFEKNYQNTAFSHVFPFEVLRKKLLSKYFSNMAVIIFSLVAIFVLCFISFHCYVSFVFNIMLFIISLSLIGVYSYCIPDFSKETRELKSNFINELKENCLQKILNSSNHNLTWSKEKKAVSNYLLKESQLFPKTLKIIHDDSFIGSDFKISEVKIFYESQNKFFEEPFRGIVFSFINDKKIKEHTIIEPKNYRPFKKILNKDIIRVTFISALLLLLFTSMGYLFIVEYTFKETLSAIGSIILIFAGIMLFGSIMQAIEEKNKSIKAFIVDYFYSLCLLFECFIVQIPSMFFKYAKESFSRKETKEDVTLEDFEFDKNFDVLSGDQIEARRALTPATMEKIIKLKKKYNSKEIKIAFWKNNILIAIATNKNFFEIGSFYKTLLNTKIYEKFHNDITLVSNIAKIMGNNNL